MTDKNPGAAFDDKIHIPNETLSDLRELDTAIPARNFVKLLLDDDFDKALSTIQTLGPYAPVIMAEAAIIMDRMLPRRSRELLRFLFYALLLSNKNEEADKACIALSQKPEIVSAPV